MTLAQPSASAAPNVAAASKPLNSQVVDPRLASEGQESLLAAVPLREQPNTEPPIVLLSMSLIEKAGPPLQDLWAWEDRIGDKLVTSTLLRLPAN
jgi:hypothetical protein